MVAPQDRPDVREIVLTGPTSARLATADDLAGRTVHVRRSSSYYESLSALNDHFRKAGMAKVKLVLVPEALEDEDIMEMTNAGLFEAMLSTNGRRGYGRSAGSHGQYRVALREGGRTGWPSVRAVRSCGGVDRFHVNWAKKQGVIAYRLERSMKRVKELKDPSGTRSGSSFRRPRPVDRYGARYA
jgi:hypothetical protein